MSTVTTKRIFQWSNARPHKSEVLDDKVDAFAAEVVELPLFVKNKFKRPGKAIEIDKDFICTYGGKNG